MTVATGRVSVSASEAELGLRAFGNGVRSGCPGFSPGFSPLVQGREILTAILCDPDMWPKVQELGAP